jgi:class 3 adenylate cyclase
MRLAAEKRFPLRDHREARLRGFDEPVRLFEVRWQEA